MVLIHGPVLHWYYISDSEWLTWHWCWSEWKTWWIINYSLTFPSGNFLRKAGVRLSAPNLKEESRCTSCLPYLRFEVLTSRISLSAHNRLTLQQSESWAPWGFPDRRRAYPPPARPPSLWKAPPLSSYQVRRAKPSKSPNIKPDFSWREIDTDSRDRNMGEVACWNPSESLNWE